MKAYKTGTANAARFIRTSIIPVSYTHLDVYKRQGKDREQGSDQYIANMCDGAVAGFKYFDLRETSKVRINIKGKATGVVYVSTEEGGKPVAKIQVKPCKEQHGFAADVNGLGEKEALYFSYKGTGAFNFMSFDLK